MFGLSGNDNEEKLQILANVLYVWTPIKILEPNKSQTYVIKIVLFKHLFNIHCCNEVIIFNVLPKTLQ